MFQVRLVMEYNISIIKFRTVLMIVNNELERMWKEMIVAQFKVLSYHFPRGIEEDREKPQ
jgi:hypothetical protein